MRVSERDLQFFRRDLSKDERDWLDPVRAGRQAFRKDCLSPWRAEQEAAALRHLAEEQSSQADGSPDPLAPRLLGQQGRHLWLEPLRGIRLYDLIRLLEACATQGSASTDTPSTTAVIEAVLERSRGRLQRLQRHLQVWQGPAGLHPYPLGRKVAGLVHLLSRLLELPTLEPELRQELRQLSQQWCSWAVLPFRDATSKNVLVLIPELDPEQGDPQRLAWLRQQLQAWPLLRWQQLPMRDVDFSSLLHSTVPEDDPISLLAHQRTLPYSPFSASALTLLPERHGIEPERAALGLLVRWLRFGGRKLAYRLLHPEACSLRFRHDNSLHYFTTMRSQIRLLDPGLEQRIPRLLERLEAIGLAFGHLHMDAALFSDAYIERFPHRRQLWQESPLVGTALLG
ncbi:MAG: hypothetical protein NTV57_16180 [Cyanobacteria bacterium]|nr:hypothetical protein [Cyanobacteriota bacterium]